MQNACPSKRERSERNKKKKESFGAWSDSASSLSLSSNSENEEANFCFVAEEEVNSYSNSSFYTDVDHNEELIEELQLLGEKYIRLKKDHDKCNLQLNSLLLKCKEFQKENDLLKQQLKSFEFSGERIEKYLSTM
ncbi:hypothetical protein, partial [Escherichia coli]|uniref:hypothetical protein n=1 Tax=Escherichia coli TaxID=562 RepID=UPI001939936C